MKRVTPRGAARQRASAAAPRGLRSPSPARPAATRPASAGLLRGRGLDVFACGYLLLGSTLESSGALRTTPGKLAALALFAALGAALLRFRRWADETPHALRFFPAFAGLVAWLLIENCAIWAVSASDLSKYAHTPPLQDNVELGYTLLRARLSPAAAAALDGAFRHEWIGIKQKLVALIALGFAAVFDAVPFSGFGMMTRFVACVCGARAIRTVAFLLTVLPNPRPGCYARRFPPVPEGVLPFLRVGLGRIRSGGGCNDLVLSGHAVIYAAVCCAYSEYYPGGASKLLWLALARSSIRGPLTQQHYSVDMFLAAAVTALTWRAVEGVYPAAASRLPPRPPGQRPDAKGKLQWGLTAAVFLVLATLGVIIIIGGA